MAEKSVIVIGAGLAGMSAAAYGAMNGYKVEVFERHVSPGGVVASWKRKGFTIDGGIHFLMGYNQEGTEIYRLYEELGIISNIDVLPMESYGLYVDQESGAQIEVGRDLDAFMDQVAGLSKPDEKLVRYLVKIARKLAQMDTSFGLSEPHELVTTSGMIREMWRSRGVLRFFMGTPAKTMTEFTRGAQSNFIRELLLNLFLPSAPVWFVANLLALLANDELGNVKQSSLDFSRAIESRAKELGAVFHYKSHVAKVLVENDRARGIRMEDGTEHRADFVISAADGHATIFDMLEGRYLDQKIKERYENWDLFKPFLLASFGAGRTFPDEPYLKMIRLTDPITVAGEENKWMHLRTFNYNPDFSPPGKCGFQATIESRWDYWSGLREKDRAAYDEMKNKFASEVLDRLESFYPGIGGKVEMTDVATPYTTWRYTRNHKGSYEGWLLAPEVITTRIDRTLPGLKNFYMAGQWIEPGGGVPPCLFSGMKAIKLLAAHDGREFRSGSG